MTLRLPASVLARYEAMGESYRAKMEAALVAAVAVKRKAPDVPAKRPISVSLPVGPPKVAPGSRLKKR